MTEPLSDDQAYQKPPLRDRIPEYLAVFGVGLGAAILIGAAIGGFSSADILPSIGYTIAMLGVVMLLAGGASGGGYTNMGIGAVGAMFGSSRADEDAADHERRHAAKGSADPMGRLRRGLRPEANPRAFWQVLGGVMYIVIGIAIAIAVS